MTWLPWNKGCMAVQLCEVIAECIDTLCSRYAPVYRALERTKRTGLWPRIKGMKLGKVSLSDPVYPGR